MTFLGPYDGKQSLHGEILDVFCKKSEHWLPTGVLVCRPLTVVAGIDQRKVMLNHISRRHFEMEILMETFIGRVTI